MFEEEKDIVVEEEVFEDETIVCVQCGQEFVFSAGEKAFFKEKGLQNKPKYCKECRAAKKNAQRSREPREMFPAVCSNCGAECMVPFQPNEDKPVYCDACFKERRNNQ